MMDQLINPKHAVCAFDWEFKLCSTDKLLLFVSIVTVMALLGHNNFILLAKGRESAKSVCCRFRSRKSLNFVLRKLGI
jgi:hypothetical protein